MRRFNIVKKECCGSYSFNCSTVLSYLLFQSFSLSTYSILAKNFPFFLFLVISSKKRLLPIKLTISFKPHLKTVVENEKNTRRTTGHNPLTLSLSFSHHHLLTHSFQQRLEKKKVGMHHHLPSFPTTSIPTHHLN